MAQYDGSIRINTQINTRGMYRGLSTVSRAIPGINSSFSKLSNTVKKTGMVIAAVFSTRALVQFGRAATRLGSELQEVENVVSVAFPHMTKEMEKFASSAAKNFGLSETMAKRYSALFGTMAKQFSFTEKEAFEMGTTLAALAGDVASFYDIDQDLAYIKLKSVFSGETETLKDIGVVMTEAALNQFALSKGIDKTVSKMTEQEKVALRYQFVLERLSQASGDFIRTSDSWANQTRVLKLQFDSLRATLGQGLINILTPVIKLINTLLAKMATLAESFKAFTELITGHKAPTSKGAGLAGLGAETAADGYNDAAEGAENLANATEKAAEETKKAEKAAEGYLSPLDEINKIGKEDIEVPEVEDTKGEDTGGPSAIPAVDCGNLEEGETALDKMKGVLDALIERAKELSGIFKKGFFGGLGDYKPRLEDLKKDIASIGRTLKEIFTDPAVLSAATRFSDQLAYTLGQVAGSVASIGLTIAQNLIGGLEKYLTQNKERIKDYLVSMFDIGTDILKIIGDLSAAFADIFSVFGGDTAQQITGNLIGIFAEVGMMISENATKLGRDILNMIAQPIIDNKEKIKEAIQGTLEAIEPFTSGLLDAVQKVRDAVTEIYDQHLKPLFDSVADGFSEIFGKLLDGYNKYIVPVLQGLGDRFKELMAGPFGEAVDKIKEFVGKLIDSLRTLWEEVLVPLFGWVADNIMPILADIIGYIGGTAMIVLEALIKAVGNIADVLSGVIDFIVGVFTGDWEKAWTGIKEIFSGIWELIKGIVSSAWEAIKNNISGMLRIIKDLISANWNGIKTFASTVWNAIKTVISTVWNIVKNVTSSAWDGIKNKVSGIWEGMKSTASDVFGRIRDIISGAWNSVKSTTSTIWNGIKDAVKSPINTIIDFINSLLRGIQTMQNGIADALNNLSIDLPGWVQDLTGYSSLGFNVGSWTAPQIPHLAQGTVVPPNREFMAVLGDNKREPEVVSPVSTLEEASKRGFMSALSEMGLTSGGNSGTIIIKQYLDGKQVTQAVIKEGKLQQMSTGNNIFALG